MKQPRKSQGITMLALVAALGAAVYMNWSFAQKAPETVTTSASAGSDAAVAAQTGPAAEQTSAVVDPLEQSTSVSAAATDAETQSANKNYGEAQLVSASKDSGTEFFDSARLARTKTRDEALDTLQKSLKGTSLDDKEKSKFTSELSSEIDNITAESDLETLIKAKGFADCVVQLDSGKASVTVMTESDALTKDEVTQIRDAILKKCHGLAAQDITIVEVK
jgi:stage III sporulation protein AH